MTNVHFDIDTQLDFIYPTGALYVPGAEAILPAVVRLNRAADVVVSTACAHTETDAEFSDWPRHCIAGTIGQSKPQATLLDKRAIVPPSPAPLSIGGARQIILEKRALDLFTNPNLSSLLDALGADQYVVYGVVTEYCVRFAALGLLRTGKPVTLVTDAIRALDEAAAERLFSDFTAGGGRLATVSELV